MRWIGDASNRGARARVRFQSGGIGHGTGRVPSQSAPSRPQALRTDKTTIRNGRKHVEESLWYAAFDANRDSVMWYYPEEKDFWKTTVFEKNAMIGDRFTAAIRRGLPLPP